MDEIDRDNETLPNWSGRQGWASIPKGRDPISPRGLWEVFLSSFGLMPFLDDDTPFQLSPPGQSRSLARRRCFGMLD